jgi:hypothetical protein
MVDLLYKQNLFELNEQYSGYRIIRPVVIYGAEAWTVTDRNENNLMTWERKISSSCSKGGG